MTAKRAWTSSCPRCGRFYLSRSRRPGSFQHPVQYQASSALHWYEAQAAEGLRYRNDATVARYHRAHNKARPPIATWPSVAPDAQHQRTASSPSPRRPVVRRSPDALGFKSLIWGSSRRRCAGPGPPMPCRRPGHVSSARRIRPRLVLHGSVSACFAVVVWRTHTTAREAGIVSR